MWRFRTETERAGHAEAGIEGFGRIGVDGVGTLGLADIHRDEVGLAATDDADVRGWGKGFEDIGLYGRGETADVFLAILEGYTGQLSGLRFCELRIRIDETHAAKEMADENNQCS